MTDARFRQAEREATIGDLHDEAAALSARVRAGTLSRTRLELAAHAGHPAAIGFFDVVREDRVGEVCCCGSTRDDGEHGSGNPDSYTHGFVHACEHYAGDGYTEADCRCSVTVTKRTVNAYRDQDMSVDLQAGHRIAGGMRTWLRRLAGWRGATVLATVAACEQLPVNHLAGGMFPEERRRAHLQGMRDVLRALRASVVSGEKLSQAEWVANRMTRGLLDRLRHLAAVEALYEEQLASEDVLIGNDLPRPWTGTDKGTLMVGMARGIIAEAFRMQSADVVTSAMRAELIRWALR